MEGYTKKKVVEITGLTPRQVQFYTEEGVVVPAVDNPIGRGRVRRYSRWNLAEFLLIKQLVSHGIKLGTIKEAVGFWSEIEREYDGEEGFPLYLMLAPEGGKPIHVEQPTKDAVMWVTGVRGENKAVDSDEMEGFDSLLIVNVGRIRDTVERA